MKSGNVYFMLHIWLHSLVIEDILTHKHFRDAAADLIV